jgi:hypothetical protein
VESYRRCGYVRAAVVVESGQNCMQGTPRGNLVKCEVCGQEYGLSHKCTGISPLVTPDEMAPAPGLRFAPLHYLQESFKILTWNDESVRRTAKDNNSLVYGLVILAVGTAAPFQLMLLRKWSLGYPTPWSLVGVRFVQMFAYSLIWIICKLDCRTFW